MLKHLTAVLLLLPAFAYAECGFTNDGNSMTIVVGSNAKCLSSEAFRQAFKSGIAQALDESEPVRAADQRRAFDDRNQRSSKLWAIAERRHQETLPGGRYFGQKR